MLIHRVGLEIANAGEKEDPKGNAALQTVCIDDKGQVSACDGLMWLRMGALVDEPDLFTTDELADLHPMRADRATLPIGVVRDFNAACKRGKSVDQVVVSSDEAGQTTLATADGKTTRTFLVKPGEAVFPNVDATLSKKPPMARVLLSVDLLRKLLRTLKSCDAKSVAFTIYGPADPIRIDANCMVDENKKLIEGAIMPMRDADAQEQPEKSTARVDDTHVSLTDTETGEVLFEGSGADLTAVASRIGRGDVAAL